MSQPPMATKLDGQNFSCGERWRVAGIVDVAR
jgi:hypothetical protein